MSSGFFIASHLMSLNAHDRHQKWKWEQENIYGRRFESEDKDQAVTDLDLLKRHHQLVDDTTHR